MQSLLFTLLHSLQKTADAPRVPQWLYMRDASAGCGYSASVLQVLLVLQIYLLQTEGTRLVLDLELQLAVFIRYFLYLFLRAFRPRDLVIGLRRSEFASCFDQSGGYYIILLQNLLLPFGCRLSSSKLRFYLPSMAARQRGRDISFD